MGFLPLILLGAVARADCPPPTSEDIARISGLARQWDQLGDRMPVAADPAAGDVRTQSGAVLDPSCATGDNAANAPRIRAAIEAGLTRALERSEQCFRNLRIAEMPDVITVLRRTRIRCRTAGRDEDDLIASMSMFYRRGHNRSRFTAGATHNYNMEVVTPRPGSPMEGLFMLSADDLGSYLAHEAMHTLSMNNRDWHNTFTDREFRGCERSVYEDRVYFTQAACFPDSFVGDDFYATARNCPGLCERALTEIDPEAARRFTPSDRIGRSDLAYGPPLGARAYSAGEAGRVCARIRARPFTPRPRPAVKPKPSARPEAAPSPVRP